MKTRIYVGNIDVDGGSGELAELFGRFGSVVTARIVRDAARSPNKGFGYVTMATPADACAAVTALSGHLHRGRALIVQEGEAKAEYEPNVASDRESASTRNELVVRSEFHSVCAGLKWTPGQREQNTADPHASMHRAAFEGDIVRVRILATDASAIGTRDRTGATPLHVAARRGHAEIVTVLLAAGANLDAKNGHNKSPLYVAARSGNRATAKLLLERGATVACEGTNKRSPMHWAAYHGQTEVVRLMVESGGDVNAQDRDSLCSPLHYAAMRGHAEVANYLLAQGAQSRLVTQAGLTAQQLAAQRAGVCAVGVEERKVETAKRDALEGWESEGGATKSLPSDVRCDE
jgi:hypothetical protein